MKDHERNLSGSCGVPPCRKEKHLRSWTSPEGSVFENLRHLCGYPYHHRQIQPQSQPPSPWSWKDQGRSSYGCPWSPRPLGPFECGGKKFEALRVFGSDNLGCFSRLKGVSAGCCPNVFAWLVFQQLVDDVKKIFSTHSAWVTDGEVVWRLEQMGHHPSDSPNSEIELWQYDSPPRSLHHHHHHHHDQKIIRTILMMIIIIIIIADIIPACPILWVFSKILIISHFMRKYYLQTTLSSLDSHMSLLVISISDFLFQLLHDSPEIHDDASK